MSRKRDETESIPELREAAETDAQLGVAGEGHRLAPGARLGRYLILYRVGAGGMGEVYAAFDPQLDRKVAVKIARGEAGSETTRLLQRREGQALARLRHPNVVTVHDVGEHAGRLFLAMEFVDGPTLGGWLNEDRPWRRVVELFLQAGRGLAAVHGARLVHQDFKPGNAMVGADGVVRIVDFGLARGQGSSTPAPGAGNGEHSQPRGTPGYLAPERLAGHPSDARSDQYSFCVAIWRALFGRPPLDSGDGAGVPGWLRQALRKGLEAAPEDRFASMEELLAALSPERRSARRRRWAGLAGALTAAALLAGYLALRPAPAPLCTDAADHLRGVWDEPRREAIRSAFVRAGAFGAEAFFALERTLDGYVRGWVAMRTEACEATHLRGEQSQHLLDLRMICLDDRLEGLRALTGALERADREVVVQALPAAMRLRSLSECADRPELVLLNVPELDAEERAEADRIRAAIEEQVALYETGQEDGRSIAVVEELLAELEGLGGYPALESRAAKLLGSLRGEIREDPASVEATYLRALFAAVEAGDRNQQARVLGQLAEEVGYQQQRFEEAERWARLAEATLTALGPGHEETRFNVLHSLGFLAWSAGDYQRAESRYRRALEVGERHWGPESPNLINLLSDLAIALEQAGAKAEGGDERTALLERALRIGEKAYGASNPLLNPILVNLGSNYGIRGRYREALELAGRSLEITEAYYAENRGLGYPLLLSAENLILLDRPDEARKFGERAAKVIEQGFGGAHRLLAEAYHALGEIELLELRPEAAWAEFERAGQIRESLPASHPAHVLTDLGLGEAHLALGRFDRARAALERARDAADPRLPYRVHLAIHLRLGETLLGLGRPREARPLLEHAIGLGIPEADAVALGEARYLLARALETDDREAALGLAVAARDELARGASPRSRRLLRRVEAWLADADPAR